MRRWLVPFWGLGVALACVAMGLGLRGQGVLSSPAGTNAAVMTPVAASSAGRPGGPSIPKLDSTPPRPVQGLQLEKLGFTYNCMECHQLLESRWHYDRPMAEHQHIKLAHGENRFCLNCHHPTNRNAFVDYDGSEIPEADVTLLCAKCHGPTYRDWKAGAHGRRNGYWDTSKGTQTQLRCIQCHDPHEPKFEAMKPLGPLRYPIRAPKPTQTRVHEARTH